MEGRNLSQHKNILVNFAMFLYYFGKKKKTFYELEQWLAACRSFLKVNPLLGLPTEEPSRCPVQKKSSLNSKDCFPRRILNSVDFHTFQRTHLEPLSPHPRLAALLRLASGLRQICGEFLWTPLLLFPYHIRWRWLLGFFLPYYSRRKGIVPHLLW